MKRFAIILAALAVLAVPAAAMANPSWAKPTLEHIEQIPSVGLTVTRLVGRWDQGFKINPGPNTTSQLARSAARKAVGFLFAYSHMPGHVTGRDGRLTVRFVLVSESLHSAYYIGGSHGFGMRWRGTTE